MASISPDDLLKQLRWRYATKQFDPDREIAPDIWKTLEEALVLTPSSFGLQPWKFLVLCNREKREALVGHSWGQRQIADCSHLLIFCIPKEITKAGLDQHIAATAAARGVQPADLASYRAMIEGSVFGEMTPEDRRVWAKAQCYIALGNIMTVAALLGVDACPMEGFLPKAYSAELGLVEKGLEPVLLLPLGYRAESDSYAVFPKIRRPCSEVVETLG